MEGSCRAEKISVRIYWSIAREKERVVELGDPRRSASCEGTERL